MKPDCRRVLSQIASYSVEELSPSDASAFTRHLDDCPPCKGQWVLFEKTLTTLSQVGEADISVHQQQQMWLTCLEHAQQKAHALAENSHPKVEVLPHPFRSDSSQREGDRRSPDISRSDRVGTGNFGWIQNLIPSLTTVGTPRLSYALAGGAAAVFAASLLVSPAPQAADLAAVPAPRTVMALPVMALPSVPATAQLASFQTPPHATTGMIDYHSAMAFEPFSDHVASTLVSTTATQP